MFTASKLRKVGGVYTAEMTDERILALAEYYSDPSHKLSRKLRDKAKQAARREFVAFVRGGKSAPATTTAKPTSKRQNAVPAGFRDLISACPKGTKITLPNGVTVTA